MLHTILQHLSRMFPHTSGRLAYWHFLLFHDDAGLLGLQDIVIAILPICIYILDILAYGHIRNDDNNHEMPLEDRPLPLRALNDCIQHWLVVQGTLDSINTLDLALRASGFWGKILLAIDLFVESYLVLGATMLFFFSVGVFVIVALEKSPVVDDLFIMVWYAIDFVIFGQEALIEAEFEEDEDPEDDPFLEE